MENTLNAWLPAPTAFDCAEFQTIDYYHIARWRLNVDIAAWGARPA
jgi:hypothetical protein